MTNNNNKQMILQLFADNVVGNITAETMRIYINAIFDSSETIINKYRTLSEFESADTASVYEGSLVTITDTIPSEQGVYVSRFNQPSNRDQLTQLSSSIVSSQGSRVSHEYIADVGQVIFQAEYTDNLVDVYVDGSKIPDSKITLNSNIGVNGTVVVLNDSLSGMEFVEIISTIR